MEQKQLNMSVKQSCDNTGSCSTESCVAGSCSTESCVAGSCVSSTDDTCAVGSCLFVNASVAPSSDSVVLPNASVSEFQASFPTRPAWDLPVEIEEKDVVDLSKENVVESVVESVVEGVVENATENKNKYQEVDEKNGLILTHFLDCQNDSPQNVKENRGIITDLKGNVVCKSFDFTEQYLTGDPQLEEILTDQNFQNFRFFESYEGTILRLYNHNDIWHLSTHKKLNAFESKWGSKYTFGEMFADSLDEKREVKGEVKGGVKVDVKSDVKNDENKGENSSTYENFCSSLDKSLVYVFLVLHTAENRIVCSAPPRTTSYHIGTFENGEIVEREVIWPADKPFPRPKELEFQNLVELNDFVNHSDWKKIQGVLARNGRYNLKIVSKTYNELYQLRDNQPSLKFRYLQLRKDPVAIKQLKYLYPERVKAFDSYEESITSLIGIIFNKYKERYMLHNFVTVPPVQYHFLKNCHVLFKHNKFTVRDHSFRITKEVVANLVNDSDAPLLISLLRSLHNNYQQENRNSSENRGEE